MRRNELLTGAMNMDESQNNYAEAKQKRVCALLPHLYKILEKANEAVESRAVAAWGWEGVGQG